MNKDEQLLEIYKLHAGLADQVSNRREGANRLYGTLAVALLVFSGAALRFGVGSIPGELVAIGLAVSTILVCGSWIRVVRSYKELNREKFRVIHELEGHLPFDFFLKEWDPKKSGGKSNRYLQLTIAEYSLPLIFMLVAAATLAIVIFKG